MNRYVYLVSPDRIGALPIVFSSMKKAKIHITDYYPKVKFMSAGTNLVRGSSDGYDVMLIRCEIIR